MCAVYGTRSSSQTTTTAPNKRVVESRLVGRASAGPLLATASFFPFRTKKKKKETVNRNSTCVRLFFMMRAMCDYGHRPHNQILCFMHSFLSCWKKKKVGLRLDQKSFARRRRHGPSRPQFPVKEPKKKKRNERKMLLSVPFLWCLSHATNVQHAIMSNATCHLLQDADEKVERKNGRVATKRRATRHECLFFLQVMDLDRDQFSLGLLFCRLPP